MRWRGRAGQGGRQDHHQALLPKRAQPAGPRERRFTGTARSTVETLLSFRVGGAIRELPARLGQAVRAGAPIARPLRPSFSTASSIF